MRKHRRMITNYLYTIGKYLSPHQRDEVLKEIEEAIKSMGNPRKVAEAQMNSPRYLVGVAYIDTYWLVVKIAVIGASIGIAVSNLMAMTEAKDILQLFLKLFAQICKSGLATFGFVTLIFMAINYYITQQTTSLRMRSGQ
ncbi:MAG: hypothetical protein JJT76_08510 [Clostridiaceae bacterium]|nr:hypothetical protein [Clostridiaceae bacterium]